MVASVLLKQLVILLISIVIGTKGLGPFYPESLPVNIYGRGTRIGAEVYGNLIREKIEECGHRYNGRPYICYDTHLRYFHCIDASQVCDGYADCYSMDDEQGCSTTSRRTSSYSFTTIITTVTPTFISTTSISTSISTHVTTLVTEKTRSTTTTTTRTSTTLATSTVPVRFVYGQSSATSTLTETFIVSDAVILRRVPTTGTIAAGVSTCSIAVLVSGDSYSAGSNDFSLRATGIMLTITAQATFTCSPTSTIYMQ